MRKASISAPLREAPALFSRLNLTPLVGVAAGVLLLAMGISSPAPKIMPLDMPPDDLAPGPPPPRPIVQVRADGTILVEGRPSGLARLGQDIEAYERRKGFPRNARILISPEANTRQSLVFEVVAELRRDGHDAIGFVDLAP